MKRLFCFLSITLIALIAVSCTSMLPVRFEQFVDKVEKNGSSYSEKEWQETSAKFEKLMNEYNQAYDKLSTDDQERINKAIGRYHAVVIKSGVNSVISSFDKIVSSVSSKVKGFLDGVGSFLNELGLNPSGE